MENEKRMVGDYTVLCAVNIGSREIILAENEQDSSGERFLCCYGERNDIFEKFTECAVGDDYIDAALFFAERIKKDAEQFRAEVEKLDIPVTVITQVDCIPDHYKNDINGKIIAINPAVLKPEYQRADRQLYLVTGGFGASANARGSAVFCRNLYDGKDMSNGSMFAHLEKFKNKDFWSEHRMITFNILTDKQEYEIVAVFRTVVYTDSPEAFKFYRFIDAESANEFDDFIAKSKELSFYDTGVTAEYGDKLITLSTCEYSRNNSRLVVVAKRITEDGGADAAKTHAEATAEGERPN